MNTRCGLAVATLVGLATLYVVPVQSAGAGNSQPRYSIITEDGVPGEVVQPPRKKLKKKTAPGAPETQKKQPSGSNYSSRSQAEAKKKLLDEAITEAEPKREEAMAEAGAATPAVKRKKKSNEIFDLFGKPTNKAKKQETGKTSPTPATEVTAKKPAQKATKIVRKPPAEAAKQQLARPAERKAQELALAKEKRRLAAEAARLEEAKKAQESAFTE
jgi:hypothetical protein